MLQKGCGFIILVLLIAFGIDCLVSWVAMMLWNWLAPMFCEGAPKLSFWVTFGIMILLSIIAGIFKSNK